MIGMTKILSAQMNSKLASTVQHSANKTASDGRILERQGITDANEKAIEKGKALQAKGEEIRSGVFEYLEKANEDINAAAEELTEAAKERREAVNERIEAARERRKTEAADEDSIEKSTDIYEHAHNGINVVINDTAGNEEQISNQAISQGKGVIINVDV